MFTFRLTVYDFGILLPKVPDEASTRSGSMPRLLRSLTLGYKFTPEICRFIGVGGMSIRLQMNNVCTWVRNKRGIDPERVEASSGTLGNKIPKSYTVSLNVNI